MRLPAHLPGRHFSRLPGCSRETDKVLTRLANLGKHCHVVAACFQSSRGRHFCAARPTPCSWAPASSSLILPTAGTSAPDVATRHFHATLFFPLVASSLSVTFHHSKARRGGTAVTRASAGQRQHETRPQEATKETPCSLETGPLVNPEFPGGAALGSQMRPHRPASSISTLGKVRTKQSWSVQARAQMCLWAPGVPPGFSSDRDCNLRVRTVVHCAIPIADSSGQQAALPGDIKPNAKDLERTWRQTVHNK